MTITRIFPSGAWRIDGIIEGSLVTRVFIGYTRREAIAAFRQELVQ